MGYDPERFRYCIYCGADVNLGLASPPTDFKPDHAKDCPMVTGLFPVDPEHLEPAGMACGECGAPFEVGDHYSELVIESGDNYDIVECVCLMCAAIGEVTE